MNDDYIDIHRLDRHMANKYRAITSDPDLSESNRDLILRYLKDSELGKTIKKGQKRKIGAGRNLQAAGYLYKMCKDWFKKDLDKVTEKDMEEFILKFDRGEHLTQYNRPYSSESKSNIKKFIKKFYKWLLGNGRFYPELVDWIDTSKRESQVKAIPRLKNGVQDIVDLIPDIKRKALVRVAFDSGFRQGELLNCRIRDLEITEEGNYYLTCRYSKTKARTVSLPFSSKILERWLKEHPKKDQPDAQLWQISRPMYYKTVKLYGKKAHKMNITVHMIRHTSATFWAPKLDRTTFCKRFGWSYSSGMPDRYIDFSKINENKIIDAVKIERYSEVQKELEEQKVQNMNLKESFKRQEQEFKELKKLLLAIAEEKKIDTLLSS